jgi:hypothetical protein
MQNKGVEVLQAKTRARQASDPENKRTSASAAKDVKLVASKGAGKSKSCNGPRNVSRMGKRFLGVESNCIQWICDQSIGRSAKIQCGKPSETMTQRNLTPRDFPLTNSRLIGESLGRIGSILSVDGCWRAGRFLTDSATSRSGGAVGDAGLASVQDF